MGKRWTRPADVRETVRKKWPVLLQAFATGQEWKSLDIPLRGPGPAELGARLGDVQSWAAEWASAARGPLRVEYEQVGGRLIGTNTIPARAWLDSYDHAWHLLGARGEVRQFTDLAEQTKTEASRLTVWLERRPVKPLELADDWANLLATVRWIDERQVPGMYLRQADVPGVGTKFTGRHRGVLGELLSLQLDPTRIDNEAPDFEGRYRFGRKPGYVRLRCADGPTGLRRRERDHLPGVPAPAGSDSDLRWRVRGRGPRIAGLAGRHRHGLLGRPRHPRFAILNRLRRRFPHVRSMLMDRATLIAHESQWVTEPSPATAVLDQLTGEELACFQDLASGVFGPAVRLEQERVSFSALERALTTLA